MINKRPPVISIIGGVNNGKTTFLKKILKKNFLEHDNITQSIRLIKYNYLKEKFVFIDTPGHYLFSFIIKTIIDISDITIFVLNINEKINNEERLFIEYISKNKKPVIFLINKIDILSKKEEENKIFYIEKEISKSILLEKSGGEAIICKTSLINSIGINEVLKNISLLTYINEIKNDESKNIFGYILESKYSKYLKFRLKGILKNGNLKLGDEIYLKKTKSKILIKKIFNLEKKKISYISASEPFIIYGFKAKIGEKFLINNKKIKVVKKIKSKKKKYFKFFFKKKLIIFKSNCNFKLLAIKKICKLKNIKSTFKFIFLDIGLIKESDLQLSKYLNCKLLYYIDFKLKKQLKNVIVFNNIHNIFNYLENIKKKKTFKIEVLRIFKISKINFAGCKIYGELKINSELVVLRKKIFYLSKVSIIILNKVKVNCIKDGFFCLLLKEFDLKIGDLIYSLNNEEFLQKNKKYRNI